MAGGAGCHVARRAVCFGLTAAGCNELVAETTEEYIELAANLARDMRRLDFYRQNLRQMMGKNGGFSDSAVFVARIEDAYAAMIEKTR